MADAQAEHEGYQNLQSGSDQVASILQQLQSAAGPGKPYTFAGRVLTGKQTPESVLARIPTSDLSEGANLQMPEAGALASGAVAMREGKAPPRNAVVNFAQLAKPGQVPTVEFDKMWPAIIDEQSGEVLGHLTYPAGPGGHAILRQSMMGTKGGATGVRGWVDPNTFSGYSEPMMEQILLARHAAGGGVGRFR